MELGKYVRDPKAYCAKAHHDALGIWPATHAAMVKHGELKSAGGLVAAERVGPKGYVHGWIYVGGGGLAKDHTLRPGDQVKGHHGLYGDVEGTVTSVHRNGDLVTTVHKSGLFGPKDLTGIALQRREVTHVGRGAAGRLGSVTQTGRAAGMAGSKKPYGDVAYADPGYLDANGEQVSKSGKPGVKRYPLDEEHVMSAWSYINQADNASQYTPAQLATIKGHIKSAMARFGHKVSDDSGSNSAGFEGEFRTVPFEVASSAAGGDGLTFEGYAAVYDQRARIGAYDGDFDEQIARGAFRSITDGGKYPVLMFEHGKHPLIGTLPLGRITDARDDANGLWIEARLTDNWLIQPVRDAIADKAVTGMSFRFTVSGDDGQEWEQRAGDVDLRTLRSLDVPELGPVVFPAYEPTTASVRSQLDRLPVIGRPQASAGAASDRGRGEPDGELQATLSRRFCRDGDALALRGIEGVRLNVR